MLVQGLNLIPRNKAGDCAAFRFLANARMLKTSTPSTAGWKLVYDWYCCDFIHPT